MSDDIIKRALGMDIVPYDENKAVVIHQEDEDLDDSVELDFEYVRENLTELISQGKEAIAELLVVAKQSQHPRAFEVVATLLKATADINSDLLAVHKKKIDLNPNRVQHTKGVGPVTNNLFVGSTAELQAFIEAQKSKKYE